MSEPVFQFTRPEDLLAADDWVPYPEKILPNRKPTILSNALNGE